MTKAEMERLNEIIGNVNPTRLVWVILSDNMYCRDDCGLYDRCPFVAEIDELEERGSDDDPINSCQSILEHYIRFGEIRDLRKECDKYV